MKKEKHKKEILALITNFGGIGGEHHKQWLLNKIVEVITTTESEYQKWVIDYEEGEDGAKTYTWDIGIAP